MMVHFIQFQGPQCLDSNYGICCLFHSIPGNNEAPIILTLKIQIRGATNAIMKLQEERKRTGKDKSGPLRVVTQSSGNHGLGLAMAAKSCGISATVVMPSNCPPMKVKAIEDQEGEVILGTLSVEVSMFSLIQKKKKKKKNSRVLLLAPFLHQHCAVTRLRRGERMVLGLSLGIL